MMEEHDKIFFRHVGIMVAIMFMPFIGIASFHTWQQHHPKTVKIISPKPPITTPAPAPAVCPDPETKIVYVSKSIPTAITDERFTVKLDIQSLKHMAEVCDRNGGDGIVSVVAAGDWRYVIQMPCAEAKRRAK